MLSILLFIASQTLLAFQMPHNGITTLPDLDKNTIIPDHYPDLDSLNRAMWRLVAQAPDLAKIEIIGYSTVKRLPIYALKLSDNATENEDESTLLFSGLHHAREPLGAQFCLHFIEECINRYKTDPDIRNIVEENEIWVVPVVNPDGYDYMMKHARNFPWWRKNLRFSPGDSTASDVYYGVDLNRNYDFNWAVGGEGEPSNWFFRGAAPASELEVQAMQLLAERENILAGATFHSYGEAVLFPWGNYYATPDQPLILRLAEQVAALLKKADFPETYGIAMLDGRAGQSSNWMHAKLRAVDFTFELGNTYFPDEEQKKNVLQQTFRSITFYIAELMKTGIRGHIYDKKTAKPVHAEVRIKNFETHFLNARYSDNQTGRFERLVLPGSYGLRIHAEGYFPVVMNNVIVKSGDVTKLDIFMTPLANEYLEATH